MDNYSKDKLKDQHFMINEYFIKKLVEYSDLKKDDEVLEIGGGSGNLTSEIYKKVKKLFVYEKDLEFCKILKEKYNYENVQVNCEDILNSKLPKFNKILSNPPYQVLEQIFLLLINQKRYDFDLCIITVPSNFKEIITAKVNDSEFSVLSSLFLGFFDVTVLEKVPREAFDPMPRVLSYMIKITPTKDNEFLKQMLREFFIFKNKKLKNIIFSLLWNLKDKTGKNKYTKRQVKELLKNIEKKYEKILEKTISELSNKEIKVICRDNIWDNI